MDALLRAIGGTTNAFTTPSPSGYDQLNCFADDIPWVVYQAAVLAEKQKGRLLLTARRRTHEVPSRSAALVTGRIKSVAWFELSFCKKDLEESVSVAVWERRDGEGICYCRAQNSYAKRLPIDVFERLARESPGRLDLSGLYELPVDSMCNFEIDAVCRAGRTLRYTLRSIALFAPWVRRVHVIGAAEPPDWLREHPKVRWLREAHVAPAGGRYALESCLTRIDDLTEQFVYFDVGTLLGTQIAKQDLFAPNGMSIAYLEPRGMAAGVEAARSPSAKALIRARELIETTFGVSPTQVHAPAPQALQKSVLDAMEARFASTFAEVRESGAELAIATLYHHFAFQTCEALRTTQHSAALVHRGNGVELFAQMLSGKRKRFFAIHEDDGADHAARTDAFLEAYLPESAPWEG